MKCFLENSYIMTAFIYGDILVVALILYAKILTIKMH